MRRGVWDGMNERSEGVSERWSGGEGEGRGRGEEELREKG
jgi:hypothetical protein